MLSVQEALNDPLRVEAYIDKSAVSTKIASVRYTSYSPCANIYLTLPKTPLTPC
jgi:hypothetical protein